ncbi:DUF1707 SHOCT-like domain-containing protein [Nocardia sp. NBC_00416]|uniref:DUF1707 SHOCT-like domain-containing protein n=1 Tax=Nocardia sp. NBC_00416 TaxID=2975991 RepID=UPI002E1A3D04
MATAVPDDPTRARDIDRAETSTLLDAAYAEGQLDADEYHDRVARARAAKTLGALRPLVVDLQVPAGMRGLLPRPEGDTGPTVRRTGSRPDYSPRTRARDADRANAGELIDAGRRDGQLTEEEHRTLTELLDSARTLGEISDLVSDIQGSRRVPRRPAPAGSDGPGWYPALLVGVGLLAAFVGFAVTSRDAEPPAPAATAETVSGLDDVEPVVIATPDLLTADGMTVFLERYRTKFGDLTADSLHLYTEFATVDRAVPGAPNREVGYDYRGGFLQSGDITSRKSDTPTVDLATLDPAAVAAAVATAAETTRVPDGAADMIIVDTESGGDLAGRPVVRIVVSNKFDESGSIYLDPRGAVLDVQVFEG